MQTKQAKRTQKADKKTSRASGASKCIRASKQTSKQAKQAKPESKQTKQENMKTRKQENKQARVFALTFCSDSPDIPLTISGAEIRRKDTPSSPAMALAKRVFPQPGGPCKRMPRG